MPSASGVFQSGQNNDIDTAAEKLTAGGSKCAFGVLVKAHKDNAGIVYVGPKGVTADTVPATDGLPLEAGEAVFIEIDAPYKVYVIASIVNQKAFWLAV